ncbi:hypothetical protein FB45DRAFT_471841 [Roridomyces roridus]|uniref:NAD(P)-binding protein n=1 Tax=Roridomyces roridus TaxID=1738132 RepID=A0AAD7BYZ2_9AGAR|nr:hypothetical protein FB45DRAFT_471841 [Roridomyces roridus]
MASSKVWLITGVHESSGNYHIPTPSGASSGFGRSLVSSVLARGDRVIASSRTLDPIQDLDGTNDNLRLLQLDVTAGEEIIASRIAEAAAFWGHIDILVNNAGSCYLGLLEENGSAILRKQYEVNVFGLLDVTLACLPYMRAQKDGTVVVIGSRSAWTGEVIGLGAYGSSKAAVHLVAEALRAEVARFNIRILIVQPSAFRTRMVRIEDNYGTQNPIEAYDDLRRENIDWYAARDGNQEGDPDKAMEAVVDVVRGEGRAAGKPWPEFLLLGKDADRDVRAKCKVMTDHLDEWSEVVKSVDYQ